jgi:DNA-binding response OmpR family regulator
MRPATTGPILLVEDHPDLSDLLAFALRRAGYVVRTAATGSEALALAAAEPPALVLLDLKLPEQSGWEVRAALLASAPQVPVVVMSALARVQAVAERRTAAAYLQKPFAVADLLVLVERLLESPSVA